MAKLTKLKMNETIIIPMIKRNYPKFQFYDGKNDPTKFPTPEQNKLHEKPLKVKCFVDNLIMQQQNKPAKK